MESKNVKGRNMRGRSGRGHAEADFKRDIKPKLALVDGVPVLYPPTSPEHDATRNGVQIVKEALITRFSLQYGRKGRFIADDEYFETPMPDAPEVDYDPHDVQSMIFWDAYKIACAEVVREGLKAESQKVNGSPSSSVYSHPHLKISWKLKMSGMRSKNTRTRWSCGI